LSIPNAFPDAFFLVWLLDLNDKGSSYTWTSVNQNLLAGDVIVTDERSRLRENAP
jgi:hypothetical protein